MDEKYKILLFRYFYEKLNLSTYEDILKNNNIDYIDRDDIASDKQVLYRKYSKYFYLINEVDLYYLSSDENNYLSSLDVDGNIDSKIIDFINHTIDRTLFSNSQGKIIYYGPHSNTYMARDNQIVLGLMIDEFGFASENIKELDEIEKQDRIIGEIMQKIEEKGIELNIKVIKYNELFEKMFHHDRRI